ncbi:MAG TPA: AraC family transcriptional regulator [Blastocatellia bacterium]|nr:AraC family transcriptional regulator [Blastocatellia bacterium]
MRADNEREIINVWRPSDFPQLELRRGSGVARPIPRHWHEEFQLCYIESGSGELTYRGDDHPTPPASLFIVHPGEIHSNRAYQMSGCSYRTLFIEPEALRGAATEVFNRDRGVPFFPATVIYDREILALYVKLHVALENPASLLERQSLLATFMNELIARFCEHRASPDSVGMKRINVKRACEYLIEYHAENIFLEHLAHTVGLSPFHFSRLFSEQVGMPPHAFQTQVRISRAKTLLLEGWSISQVASRTGFADQSHLTRHFKRLVGITPGRYQQSSKNVQDPAHASR